MFVRRYAVLEGGSKLNYNIDERGRKCSRGASADLNLAFNVRSIVQSCFAIIQSGIPQNNNAQWYPSPAYMFYILLNSIMFSPESWCLGWGLSFLQRKHGHRIWMTFTFLWTQQDFLSHNGRRNHRVRRQWNNIENSYSENKPFNCN